MSGLGSWLWGTSQLDDAVDKATSELLPAGAEDIALNLEICDQIRSKSVQPKDAMRALKRRLNHKNPNVQNLALGLTDICVKNGGDPFLTEIASREFMDNLVSILKIPGLNLDVKNNILRLIQNWSIAFEGKPLLGYVGQVYKTLTSEGYKFPPKDLAAANSAMVDTQTAPEWIDSDVCLRCRTPFTFTNRKHHCRNCGQVFDQQCSSKTMPLPHFGITQEVRVCEGCYNKLTRKAVKTDKGHRHSISLPTRRSHGARDLDDAELQRAIQLSLEEANRVTGHARPGYVPFQPSPSKWQSSEPPIIDDSRRSQPQTIDEEDDPDLKAAIEASLREANMPQPSAPIALDSSRQEDSFTSRTGPEYSQSYPPRVPALPSLPNYDLNPLESDAILTFSQTIEQVQAQGGRDISRYPAVNELYDKANSLRPKLALSLDDAGRKEQMLSEMHEKLSQAVKLYDKLLTDQLAHPRWRAPPVASPPLQHMQPAAASYQQPSYATYNPSSTYFDQQQAESSQSQWIQAQPSVTTQTQQLSAEPVPLSPPAPPVQPPVAYSPPLVSQASTMQYKQAVEASSPPQTLPPVSLNISQYRAPAPTFQSSAPTSTIQVQSPPSPIQQPQPAVPEPAPQPSSLTRHKTVSYTASYQPSHQVAQAHLSRSNTFSSHVVHVPHVQSPSIDQMAHYTSPTALPQFPTAPTSAPQPFSMYGPAIPTGVVQQEERKEALLIDL